MRIFFVTSNVPSPGHRPAGAIATVAHEAAVALRAVGHDVTVQTIFEVWHTEPTQQEHDDLRAIRESGFEVEEPLTAPPPGNGASKRRTIAEALGRAPQAFYPALALAETVRRRAAGRRADLVLHLWSPEGLAACSTIEEAPVFAYYGNPDHKPAEARLRHPALFGVPNTTPKERILRALRLRAAAALEREHLELIRGCRWAGNVAANDAELYVRAGHPRAFYIQNMWIDRFGADWRDRRDSTPPPERGAIVGSIGNLSATGNTFGLDLLGRRVVPELRRLAAGEFAVHVYGGGAPTAPVARVLDLPEIRLRGWVDDIDAEIAGSGIFLVANNCSPDFVVGHTRVLHAWSLGACLVAHTGLAVAMPEIVHGENALLGDTGEEIAAHLASVLGDDELRRTLGDAGRRTFEELYAPDVVVGRILEHVEAR